MNEEIIIGDFHKSRYPKRRSIFWNPWKRSQSRVKNANFLSDFFREETLTYFSEIVKLDLT